MSESKKVVSCEFKKERDSQYGKMFDFKVKFEGDDKLYAYAAKNKDNPYFKVGEVADFDVVVKTGTDNEGNPWTIYNLKPVRPQGNFGGGGGKGYARKEKKDYLCENLSYITSYSKDLCVAGKIESDKMIPLVKKLLEFTEEKIGEYFKAE